MMDTFAAMRAAGAFVVPVRDEAEAVGRTAAEARAIGLALGDEDEADLRRIVGAVQALNRPHSAADASTFGWTLDAAVARIVARHTGD